MKIGSFKAHATVSLDPDESQAPITFTLSCIDYETRVSGEMTPDEADELASLLTRAAQTARIRPGR